MAQGKKKSYLVTKKKETYNGCEKWCRINTHKKPTKSKKRNTFKRLKTIEKIQRTQRLQCLTHFTS